MRKGRCLAVFGPDGSGKSTVLARLGSRLSGGPDAMLIVHWRPPLSTRRQSAERCREPHGPSPYPTWLGTIKLAYLLLVNWVGWIATVRPALHRGRWVAYDRSFLDLSCDPRRYRYAGPWRLVRLLNRLLPPFDGRFVLLTDASVIRARKCEVAAAELVRQLSRYRRLAARSGATVLDAAQPPDRLAEHIRRALA
jgi:thymidylate kinase